MPSLFASYLNAIESYLKPWNPVRLSDATWDFACYDATKLSLEELIAGLRSRPPMIEGAVIIVGPEPNDPPIETLDLRKYPMEEALAGIDTFVVAGCGTPPQWGR